MRGAPEKYDSLPRFCSSHLACSRSLSRNVVLCSWKDNNNGTTMHTWHEKSSPLLGYLRLLFLHTDTKLHLCLEAFEHILDHGLQFLQVAGSFILLLTQCQCYQQREELQLSTVDLEGWESGEVESPCDVGMITMLSPCCRQSSRWHCGH